MHLDTDFVWLMIFFFSLQAEVENLSLEEQALDIQIRFHNIQ